MGLSTTSRRNDHVGSGSTASYPFQFKIQNESELTVVVRDTDNEETELTYLTHFTVTGAGNDGGGSIALVAGAFDWLDGSNYLEADYVLSILGNAPVTQRADIRNQGPYLPATIEDQFDKQVMIAQQQQDAIDRSFKLPRTITSDDFDPTLPADVLEEGAGKVPALNDDGDGVRPASEWPSIGQITSAAANAAAAAASAAEAAASATAAATAETNAETAETNAETAQTAAETAKTAAELAETAAETAETNAETAQAAAEAAKTAAETAETNAETAQAAAEAAKTAAETAETNAETAQAAAEAARDIAVASAETTASLYSYANDAAYVAAHGAAANGDIYYNTSLNTVRVYQGGSWVNQANASVPVTTKGDIFVYGAAADRLPVGNNDDVLVPDSAQALGLKYVHPANIPLQPNALSNLGLTVTASTSLLMALKNAAGSDPSSTSPVVVGMRNATATTGQFAKRSVTGVLTFDLQQWNTLGFTSGRAGWVYAYLIDSDGAGTMKLGWSSVRYDESELISTVQDALTFTMTIASPAVFTASGNGLQNGNAVILRTTGALPTGFATNTVYYVVNNGTDGAGKFRLASEPGGTAINSSGSQSGTHTLRYADGVIVSDAVYSSKPHRLIGRVLATCTTGNWGSLANVAMAPLPPGRQFAVSAAHTASVATTSAGFGDISSPKMYLQLIPGKTGLYKIKAQFCAHGSAAGGRGLTRLNCAVGTPTTILNAESENADAGGVSGGIFTYIPYSIAWLTAGVPYAYFVQSATSSGTFTVRNDIPTGGALVTAEYLE